MGRRSTFKTCIQRLVTYYPLRARNAACWLDYNQMPTLLVPQPTSFSELRPLVANRWVCRVGVRNWMKILLAIVLVNVIDLLIAPLLTYALAHDIFSLDAGSLFACGIS